MPVTLGSPTDNSARGRRLPAEAAAENPYTGAVELTERHRPSGHRHHQRLRWPGDHRSGAPRRVRIGRLEVQAGQPAAGCETDRATAGQEVERDSEPVR